MKGGRKEEEEDVLLTVGEAARVLNLSAQMVRYLEGQGRIKALRTKSGVRLFWESAVKALAAERAAAKKTKKSK